MATNGFLKIGETTSAVFKKLATYIAVDPVDLSQIHIGRNTLNDSDGNEFNTANPFPTKADGVAGTGITPETGATGSIGWLSSIYKKLTGTLTISATSLPLPTGASTETTLSSMSAKLPATLGQKTMANSLPVVLPSDQSLSANISQIGGQTVGIEGLPIVSRESLALANKFFVASINPTIGTPIALGIAAQNAYAPLAPNILISASATKRVLLDRLSLYVGAAGTALTSLRIAIRVSTTNKYSSGGTIVSAATTPQRTASTATVRVGTVAIVALAEGVDTQRVFNGIIKNAIPIVSEVFTIDFGNEVVSEFQVAGRIHIKIPPVIIPAGGSAMINIWGPGQTAATTYEGMLYFTEE
jgi:hypothetical protein